MRILTIEDDKDLCQITYLNLSACGIDSDCAYSIEDSMKLLDKNIYDCILLDIQLPDGDGYAICESIRTRCKCPIIFISCLDDGDSVIKAFHTGADDYMIKPIDYKDLANRIKILIEKSAGEKTAGISENILLLKSFSIDMKNRIVRTALGDILSLTSTEFDIMVFLAQRSGTLSLYDEILNSVWDYNDKDALRALMTHVSNLRKKIDPNQTGIIESVRGAGYIFNDIYI